MLLQRRQPAFGVHDEFSGVIVAVSPLGLFHSKDSASADEQFLGEFLKNCCDVLDVLNAKPGQVPDQVLLAFSCYGQRLFCLMKIIIAAYTMVSRMVSSDGRTPRIIESAMRWTLPYMYTAQPSSRASTVSISRP